MCSVKRKKTEEFSWDKEKEEFLINYHRNNSSKLYGSDEFSPTEKDKRDAKLKLVEVFNEQYGTDLPVGVINERWRLIRGRVTSCMRKMGPLQVRKFAMPSELWAYDRCSWLLPYLNRTKDKRDSSEHTVPDESSCEETAVNQIEKDADNLHFCNGSSQVAISDGSKGAQYVPDFVQDGSPSVKSLDKIVETAREQPALKSNDLDVLETIGGISDQDEEMETRNLNNNPKPLDVNFPKKGKKQDVNNFPDFFHPMSILPQIHEQMQSMKSNEEAEETAGVIWSSYNRLDSKYKDAAVAKIIDILDDIIKESRNN
ncbi:hypothetical protein QAD02_013419 [Eretmocerus hayati]|uniref:Uncharacterized protein n=1 Tax=Eretmocerus hayati TaxID=131215 RepID=A0ACC2P2L7_9HYME|nr:hypothetical protein QAD02_013419 [Eretmocerus hayati]